VLRLFAEQRRQIDHCRKSRSVANAKTNIIHLPNILTPFSCLPFKDPIRVVRAISAAVNVKHFLFLVFTNIFNERSISFDFKGEFNIKL
jgi:hypothetical protein